MNGLMIVFTLLILFGAGLLKATLGFGDVLLAMPLLTLLLGIRLATPLMGLVAASLTAIMLLQHWREIDFRAAGPLIGAAVCGIPLGVLGVRYLPPHGVTVVLGIVLIAVGVYNFFRLSSGTLSHPLWAYGLGFVAGILGGAFNTGGPPIILYGTLRRWPPAQFRATLQGCLLPISLVVVAGQGLAGLWTPRVWRLFGLSLPVVFGAMMLGRWVAQRVPTRQFERGLYLALIVLGIMLVR